MPMIISLAVAFVVGLGLQKLISYRVVLPGSAIDYGRVWSGWVVFFTTLALLTGFLIYLDLERLAVWVLAVLFYGGCAFGAGWAYGKFFKGDTAESIEAERSRKPSSHFKEASNQPQNVLIDPALQLEDEEGKEKINNPHEVLEVSPLASIEVVESAYQTLIKKYHPETGKSANEIRYKEIIGAYKALAETENRAKYNPKYLKKYVALEDANHNNHLNTQQSIKRLDGTDTWCSIEEHVRRKGMELYRTDLRGLLLRDIFLKGAQMNGSKLSHVKFENINLNRANLSNVVCEYGEFKGVDFAEANLNNSSFQNCVFNGCIFNECFISKASFKGSNFTGSSFENTSLENIDFSSCILEKVSFAKTQYHKNDINKYRVSKCNFAKANLSYSIFYSQHITKLDEPWPFKQKHDNKRKIVHYTCNVILSDFSGANLSGVNFKYGYIEKCNFSDCLLSLAQFQHSKIYPVTLFTNASLYKADFTNATILNADLSTCNLFDVKFHLSKSENVIFPEGYISLNNGANKKPAEFARNYERRALESVMRRDGSNTYFSLEEHVNEGGRKLSNADLKGIRLNNISLIKAQMDKADISYSEIKHVDLTGADLSNAVCREGVFINVKFSNVNLDNTLFESCIFQDCNLNKCMINNSTFKSSDFRGSSFEKTTIKNSDFSDSKLDEIVFYGSDAITSEKKITTIKITNFSNASLRKAHFYGKLDFIDFSSANLEGSVFNDSELILCNFLNSALKSAKLVGSIIKSSTVSVRASFKNANLVKCDFSNSQIQDADFSQSKLIDANFNNCQLSNVTFPNNFETNNPML